MLIFIVTLLISFIGSLQVGVLSTNIVMVTVNRGKSAGYLVALGGMLPEFIYSAIALLGVNSLRYFLVETSFLTVVNAVVFILAGIYILFSESTTNKKHVAPKGKGILFLTGFGIALLNPQLILFWLSVLLYLQDITWLYSGSLPENLAVVAGSGIGAFCLFQTLIWISSTRRNDIIRLITKYNINRIVGGVFVILGVGKLVFIFAAK